MKKTTPAMRLAVIARTTSRHLLTLLALGMLATACKKDGDDVDGGGGPTGPGTQPPAKEEGYYPSKTNTVWKYRNDDDGDITENTLSVVSQKDSAGGKVIHYQSQFSDGTRITPFVHATSSQITYANTMPSDFAEVLEGLRQDPNVSNVSLTGVPMLQKLPANPKAGDLVQFSEPLKMSWTQREEGQNYNVAFSFAFSNGEVVGFDDVTTPAGTFKKSVKWQYKATIMLKVNGAVQSQTEMQHTVWYAKGVGMVKAIETGDNTTSTTELTAIQ